MLVTDDVIPFDRLLMAQAASVGSAMLAGIVGGLAAQSWIWAIACAMLAYGTACVGVMVWMARRLRSHASWSGRARDSSDFDIDWSEFDGDSFDE
jgi:hypothetical protein